MSLKVFCIRLDVQFVLIDQGVLYSDNFLGEVYILDYWTGRCVGKINFFEP